jgi:hypothetical protein
MNSSGSLAFGGPTGGVSVNLEILQSASSPISFNTSAFRVLANTPSGGINLGSVYGQTYTRYGTAAASFSAAASNITFSISGGQPFAQFYIYLYNTTSGQPFPGYIAPNFPASSSNIGTLDGNGDFYNVYSVSRSDPYWFRSFNVPGPYTNFFYVYQGATGQTFPSSPFPLGTRIADLAVSS